MIRENMCADSRMRSRPLTKKKRGSTSQSTQTPFQQTPIQGANVTARPHQEFQFHDIFPVTPIRPPSPEQRLWQSVLVEALRCILNGAYVKEVYRPHRARARQRLREEAVEWVNSDEDGFLTVCEYAEVDPSYIRRIFREMLESDENLDGQRKSLRPRY